MNIFFGGPTCKVVMQNFKIGGVTVLAVQLFNKIKKKKKKKMKMKRTLKNMFRCISHMLRQKKNWGGGKFVIFYMF